MAEYIIGLKGERTIFVLVNGHDAKFPSKFFCLHQRICDVLSLHQRIPSLLWVS